MALAYRSSASSNCCAANRLGATRCDARGGRQKIGDAPCPRCEPQARHASERGPVALLLHIRRLAQVCLQPRVLLGHGRQRPLELPRVRDSHAHAWHSAWLGRAASSDAPATARAGSAAAGRRTPPPGHTPGNRRARPPLRRHTVMFCREPQGKFASIAPVSDMGEKNSAVERTELNASSAPLGVAIGPFLARPLRQPS